MSTGDMHGSGHGSGSASGPRRRFVVRADGGSRGNPGPAAYGTLVADADSGVVLAEDAKTIGTTTNNVAEYRGLIAGLLLVQALDPDAAIEVRMDSKLVVEQMAGRWKIRHADLKPLADEARRTLPAGQARWTWVPREENKRADQLANAALDGRVDEVIEHPLPSGVLARTTPREPIAADDGLGVTGPAGVGPAGVGGPAVVPADVRVDLEPPTPPVPAPAGRVRAAPAPVTPAPVTPAPVTPAAGLPPVAARAAARTSSRAGADHGETLFAADPAPAAIPPPVRELTTTTTLLFLRHARTADNVGHRFSGRRGADPGLDETGRNQALAVARTLTVFDAVVSSPMRRTTQTARVVAAEADLPVSVVEDLVEYDSGEWDGLTDVQAAERDPAFYATWLLSPDVAPPGGESVRAVATRVQAAVRRLVAEHPGETVLVVSHAVPIACALLTALDAPLSAAPRLTVRNTSLTRIRYPVDGPPEPDTILLPPGVPLPD